MSKKGILRCKVYGRVFMNIPFIHLSFYSFFSIVYPFFIDFSHFLRPISEPISEPINEPINNSLKVAISSRQLRIISAIKRNPFMNREELAEETNLSIATLRREIGVLRQEGYLSREGSNKNGQWIVLNKV